MVDAGDARGVVNSVIVGYSSNPIITSVSGNYVLLASGSQYFLNSSETTQVISGQALFVQLSGVNAMISGVAITAKIGGTGKNVSQTKTLTSGVAYSTFDVISESQSGGTVWIFSGVVNNINGEGSIKKSIAMLTTSGLTAGLTMHLYKIQPTCNANDNTINTSVALADRDGYVGKIDYPNLYCPGAGASEASSLPGGTSLPLSFITTSNDTRLYGVVYTKDAFTPYSGASMYISLDVDRLSNV
jgi:hypothetical protein